MIYRTACRIFYRPVITLGALCSVLSVPLLAQAQPPASSSKLAPGQTQLSYGGVRISRARKTEISFGQRRSDIIFHGPGVVVESRYKTTPTQFRFVADTVVGHRTVEGKRELLSAELSGNIHYTISQQTDEGRRTLEGTAGHATYDDRTARIHLTEGVNATLTDPANLEGPGALRAGSVVIPTDRAGQFELAGSSDVNDIAVTLKQPSVRGGANAANPEPGFLGPIHLYHFRSGVLELGHMARVSGSGATVDFADLTDKTQGQVKADSVTAEFGKRLHRASGSGGVDYRLERTDKDGTTQTMTGTSDAAVYNADAGRGELTGNVTARLIDPVALVGPAHLTAGRVVQERLTSPTTSRSAEPVPVRYRYEISGSQARNHLQFTPHPPKQNSTASAAGAPAQPVLTTAGQSTTTANGQPAPSKPKPLQFAVGTVDITDFGEGSFEPGKSAEFTGANVTVKTSDTQARTATQLEGRRLSAAFAADGALTGMEAAGSVRYNIEQPDDSGKGMQTIQGTAAQATFTNGPQEQQIVLKGPLQGRLSNPNESEPTVMNGEQGDLVTLNLTTSEMVIDSPNQTAHIDFTPRKNATTPKPNAKPAKPTKTKHQ